MSIIFNPIGTLNIAADSAEISDGDMQRCKNLRMGEDGVLKTRDGSFKFNTTALVGTMDFIIEQGGVRYIMGEEYIYRNETLISDGVQCATPTFSPVEGSYAAAQSVTISTTTVGATIYYTLDGTAPTAGSLKFTVAITVPLFTTVRAIAIRGGFLDSAIALAYYSSTTAGTLVTETDADTFITETDSNTLITEGTA
jgi:hypothetical protein